MHRIHRGALIAALATGFVLVPAAAQAHVGVTPDSMTAEGSAVLTFSFTHGCEDSPTTALRVTMPEGLTSVSPTVDGLWDVAVDRADNGLVSAVTYTAATPIAHDLRGEVTMAVRLGEDAAETLAFPVEQRCETGANEWVEIAEDGQDPHDLESPAPVVTVSDAAAEAHDDHGTSGEHKASDTASADAVSDGSAGSGAAPAIGIALGAAGLLAGIAALFVAVRASRR